MPVYNFESTVEIFRTNVRDEIMADKVVSVLLDNFPEATINFDLEDCDRILRIEDIRIDTEKVKNILHTYQIHVELIF
ncbi:hypothetical protein ED312_13380 [Sinomicrobium pectinilyticum]|uniref:Methyltransferase type 11 n=1 Tax=Sinomicrobium pectinilyticum TaxID=1084421 RepID=A0A3N0E9Z9_SINP1|nr:hypothetical protein [Sinomicrobium pectinilyticum]RNL84675.1 hypothetical protein ED312_13380 [Sinomicrobium pectinilyticum]